ncbi:transporter substrate-binding domain-containing protein [Chitinimonas sp.]|uniref:substrate-binding periplasmic protein n=1 Tax=Chitinimonas sp. TaxID=1934313 RepID=UPI002F95884C
MKRSAIALLFLCSGGTLAAQPHWKLCHEDNEVYPWILKEREGLYATLARLTARRTQSEIELVGMPWKRCLAEMQAGTIDGVLGAGFLAERCKQGVYPGGACQPDPSLHLYYDRFMLYRAKQAHLHWDGQVLRDYRKPIAVQPGFVVARLLKQSGIPTDESDKSPYQILRKVSAGMVDGAILQAPAADPLLQEVTDFGSTIERDPIPFRVYPTWLMISHQRYRANATLVQALWQAMAQARDSGEYKAAKLALGYNEPD